MKYTNHTKIMNGDGQGQSSWQKGNEAQAFCLFVVVGHREVDTWGSSHGKLQAKHVCQNRHRGSRLTIGGAYKQQLEGRYHIHPDYTSHNGCEYKFHMLLLPVSLCVILLHAPKQKSSKVWVYKFTGVVIVVLSPSLSLSPASIVRRRRRRVRVSSLNCCCQLPKKNVWWWSPWCFPSFCCTNSPNFALNEENEVKSNDFMRTSVHPKWRSAR